MGYSKIVWSVELNLTAKHTKSTKKSINHKGRKGYARYAKKRQVIAGLTRNLPLSRDCGSSPQ